MTVICLYYKFPISPLFTLLFERESQYILILKKRRVMVCLPEGWVFTKSTQENCLMHRRAHYLFLLVWTHRYLIYILSYFLAPIVPDLAIGSFVICLLCLLTLLSIVLGFILTHVQDHLVDFIAKYCNHLFFPSVRSSGSFCWRMIQKPSFEFCVFLYYWGINACRLSRLKE